jgi:type III secretory pathway component EscU
VVATGDRTMKRPIIPIRSIVRSLARAHATENARYLVCIHSIREVYKTFFCIIFIMVILLRGRAYPHAKNDEHSN